MAKLKQKNLLNGLYIKKNLDGVTEPWEQYLADLFEQLQKRDNEKRSEEPADDTHAREKMT